MKKKNLTEKIKYCTICESKKLKSIMNLNKFPLTGIFIKNKLNKNFNYYFNLKLNICKFNS